MLITNSTRDSEKISFNKEFLIKLGTKVYQVRKSVITSEPLVHLKKSAGGINPRCWANLAPYQEVAHSSGTPLKSRKKFVVFIFCVSHIWRRFDVDSAICFYGIDLLVQVSE